MDDVSSVLLETCVLAADIGLTYLFYSLYKRRCVAANTIKDLEVLGLNESLAEHISKLPGGCLEYGIIQGEVHALNEPLTSAYASHKGAIRTFRREVLKSTRYRGYWTDSSTLTSDSYEKVPFALFSPSRVCSVLVTEPRSADYLSDAFITTHDVFAPTERSIAQNVFDRIVGEINKGVQSTEQLLKNGTTLLGVGKLMVNKGTLELRPPDHNAYFLTSMSKEELVAALKSKATIFKVLAAIFGITGGIIFWITFRSRIVAWYDNYKSRIAMQEVREQLQTMRVVQGSDQPSQDQNHSCVICLTADRELVLRPCGHVCVCLSCHMASPQPRHCPVCRAEVKEIIPVYLP